MVMLFHPLFYRVLNQHHRHCRYAVLYRQGQAYQLKRSDLATNMPGDLHSDIVVARCRSSDDLESIKVIPSGFVLPTILGYQ